ncbi:hypothetical protein N7U66_05965 [Lacinutrix neustonica]|uniref:Uncharacterized protein n=1 Tax=Lacinutrix neustonica TaxID=2980107 RepID=A0A9E8SHY0_9FLAO|nr:hypothetical protein [Lacinutrix neustonica]WAC03155.1 hypothetical protein N7U66_05965 [Lacinutrix neustonica]
MVTSLAHRHGVFKIEGDALRFQLHENAKGFKLTLHAAEGWLPHLQYEQEEPFREIYRYTNREQMLGLRNPNGFVKIETFFNVICRPALISAFEKDNSPKLKKWLSNPNITFKQFIDKMAENHEYIDSFKGMQKELVHAKDSIDNKKPIHWMETLDDLMFCLNFHAEMMSAEDHLFLKKEVLPFLMNVIAALPISSAQILLALYHANIINLIPGRVTVTQTQENKGQTQVEIAKSEEDPVYKTYNMFIDCSERITFKWKITLLSHW